MSISLRRFCVGLLAVGMLRWTSAEAAPSPHDICSDTHRWRQDQQTQRCLADSPTTASMLKCVNDEYVQLDAELTGLYSDWVHTLPHGQRRVFQAAQREWVRYRDAQFLAIDALHDQLDGTMYLPVRVMQRSSVLKGRLLDLCDLVRISN